jgi:hypothetical protein
MHVAAQEGNEFYARVSTLSSFGSRSVWWLDTSSQQRLILSFPLRSF